MHWSEIYKGLDGKSKAWLARRFDKRTSDLQRTVIAMFMSSPFERQKLVLDKLRPWHFTGKLRDFWQYLHEHRPTDTITWETLAEIPPELAVAVQDTGVVLSSVDPKDIEYLERTIESLEKIMVAKNLAALGLYTAKHAEATELHKIITLAETALVSVRTSTEHKDPENIGDGIEDMLETPPAVIPTGFGYFDNQYGGFSRGALNVIRGNRAAGKTSLLIQTAIQLAHSGEKVLYFALEKNSDYIKQKAACALAHVEHMRWRTGELNGEEKLRIRQAARVLEKIPIKIFCPEEHDPAIRTPGGVVFYARHYALSHGYATIMVDHFQEFSGAYEGLTAAARRLRDLAEYDRITVIVASQMSKQGKEVYTYGGKVLEQVADMIIHIQNTDERSRKLLAVVKNRSGREGRAAFEFDGQGTRWTPAGGICPLDEIFDTNMEVIDGGEDIPF